MNRIKSIIATFKMVLAIFLAPLIKKKLPNIWLVGERRNQARDNGYCFFRYMRTHHPESNAYYLIDRCNDADKIHEYGNVVIYNSFIHYLLFAAMEVQISSHANVFWPDNVRRIRFIVDHIRFKKVFLPHGVSYGYTEWATKPRANFDLFFCSGLLEYQNVLSNYGYDKSEVAYVGIPRLDLWHEPIHVNKSQILLMPTWRAHITYDRECVFTETEYYHAYQNFIDSPVLRNFLVNNNYRLVFYLHHDMQKYASAFSTCCDNIEIVIDEKKYDIQELLRTSAVLITDYSSVHFDFAYMAKPVLYYQFDKNVFFEHQYLQTSFSAENNGFGPVAYNPEGLIANLIEISRNNFALGELYYRRMRDFYRIYDNKNSERVYLTILKNRKTTGFNGERSGNV